MIDLPRNSSTYDNLDESKIVQYFTDNDEVETSNNDANGDYRSDILHNGDDDSFYNISNDKHGDDFMDGNNYGHLSRSDIEEYFTYDEDNNTIDINISNGYNSE